MAATAVHPYVHELLWSDMIEVVKWQDRFDVWAWSKRSTRTPEVVRALTQ
jgi:hypothetical protein